MDASVPKKLLPIFKSKKRNMVLYGGRGGAKSWAAAIFLITKALKEKNSTILCTREIQNTIDDSVLSVLTSTIERLKLSHLFDIQKNKINCVNGSRFIFKGLTRNISGVKSMEGINYCWVEEAQSISRDSIDILWPTVRVENSQFIVTFNPDQETDPIYERFVIKNRDDTLLININYPDNPFFPDVLRDDMEWDKENDYDKYLHVWEGHCKNITDACIFKNKFTVTSFEAPENVNFYYGADWGFSNDPACIIRCFIHDDCLWIDQEAGGVGVEIDELPQLWDNIDGVREHKVIADSQRPDTISHMNNKGFNVVKTRKTKGATGKGYIEDGISFMRSFKMIYVHERCKNTTYEFKTYSYKQDRLTNEILPIIIDANNHYIDSIRYAIEDEIRGKGGRYRPSSKKMSDVFGKSNRRNLF